MKKFLYSIFIISAILTPLTSWALELSYPNVNIPGVGETTLDLNMNLSTLIAWLYYFIIGISGFAALVMIIYGGVQWMTSAGNPTKMGEARDKISSALLGVVIILMSWLILNLINPDLAILKISNIKKTGDCGNGIINSCELCDDGNTIDGDGCNSTCQLEGGGSISWSCGDGTLDSGEECDDGNNDCGDGCNQICKIEH
jgi:cysteine-rich repeat protein